MGRLGPALTSPQTAKALLSSRSRYPVPPGSWRRGAGPGWETEGMWRRDEVSLRICPSDCLSTPAWLLQGSSSLLGRERVDMPGSQGERALGLDGDGGAVLEISAGVLVSGCSFPFCLPAEARGQAQEQQRE